MQSIFKSSTVILDFHLSRAVAVVFQFLTKNPNSKEAQRQFLQLIREGVEHYCIS
jgi:hypothetical protein